jgi:7-carboxy-7-deazaguanine synthase (Cx14CxxC type)
MAYLVKEIFYSVQGEGAHAGRPAVFVRFAGCNLWSGREEDRSSARCRFCDTDFVGTNGQGGGRFETARDLVESVRGYWPARAANDVGPYVICTGGEPLLQLDAALIDELHRIGAKIAVETNGTVASPPGLDWICMSPKAGNELRVHRGDELKLVYPQAGLDPASLLGLDFEYFFLQPMDGPHVEENTKAALDYCMDHPRWRLSLQTHKLLGVP